MARIIYTHTDEAPLLATYSFLPIIEAYAAKAGVEVETRDISLAGRIIAQFPDRLTDEQRVDDALAELGDAGQDAGGQHHQAAQRLGLGPAAQGGDQGAAGAGLRPARLPREPATPTRSSDVRARYDKVKGSAVNPVLREGNSDRRAPASVKNYARAHPHRMGAWSRRLEDQRRDHGQRRLPLQREVGRPRRRRHAAHRARRRRRHRDRAQGVDPGAGRRGRRRHVHERRRAAPLPRRADRRGPRPTTCCSRCTSRPR